MNVEGSAELAMEKPAQTAAEDGKPRFQPFMRTLPRAGRADDTVSVEGEVGAGGGGGGGWDRSGRKRAAAGAVATGPRQGHATPRHTTPRHATPRHATPGDATPRHARGRGSQAERAPDVLRN